MKVVMKVRVAAGGTAGVGGMQFPRLKFWSKFREHNVFENAMLSAWVVRPKLQVGRLWFPRQLSE